ncbi:hypothetical protein BJ969_003971 [Saccharopolyspora gloriosae]|uniref:Protein kinase domain-containing protein n=1 Tax=Saccharopolyspora gloriosae TaxID=455344 RepID=A0A840NL82_9PSEU|nr:hypothetical protein [Saccharopolyspora gloriosae]MBB5070883.1 hypothetical protein [Saccharopolyspora gloriosae]
MKLPQLIDYQQAVQAKLFADPALRHGTPITNPLKQATVVSGGFALTFRVEVPAAGGSRKQFAVRCFHKQGTRLEERYAAVADFIGQHRKNLDFLTDVAYVPAGIQVNGNLFPIVRMPWVGGERLDAWVEDHIEEPHRLDRVRQQVKRAAHRLRAAGAAHGDLQHGNILVDQHDHIHLVDYDGMYLPVLSTLGAAERGHPDYQHPDRGESFGDHLDVFAAYVIDLSLEALKHEPRLWQDFNTGENLIFESADFADPGRSELFAKLTCISAVEERVRRLRQACEAEFTTMPAILSGERTSATPSRSTRPKRPAGPRALDAHDHVVLHGRIGDRVTIVGKVLGTRIHHPSRTTFINFGDWKNGKTFRIVGWGPVTSRLEQRYGTDATRLRGSWVTLSGMIASYKDRPQMVLDRVQTLRVLREADAERLLAPPEPRAEPTPQNAPRAAPEPAASEPAAPKTRQSAAPVDGFHRWKAPPKPQKKDDLDQRLDQMYSSSSSRTPRTTSPPPAQPPPGPANHRRYPLPSPPPAPAASPPAAQPSAPQKPPSRGLRDRWFDMCDQLANLLDRWRK